MKVTKAEVQAFLVTGAAGIEMLSRVTRNKVDDQVAFTLSPFLRDPKVAEVLASLISAADGRKLTAADVLKALASLVPLTIAAGVPTSLEVVK